MNDFRVLKFLDSLRVVFEKAGINYTVMRKILQVKFIMDGRRVPTIRSSSKNKSANMDENNFIRSLWLYGLMGLIAIPFVLAPDNYIFGMGFVFAITMFMVMTSLISDFSSVLLDVRDESIIFSKPVDSRTLSMAKIIHIFIYMFFMTISLTGPALIVSLIRHGILFFVIFLFEIILMDLLIVVLTAILYMLILKFFDGEKLKDIINYVQIVLTIAMTVGYQLFGRLFNLINLKVVFTPEWWQYFIVPIWFGAPFDLILQGKLSSYYIYFSLLSLFVPIISIIIYVKLIPSFQRNLQKLNNNGGSQVKTKYKFFDRISEIICPYNQERVFFRFASDMMKSERKFKLKVYPSLGFALIFPFIFIFNQLGNRELRSIASGRSYFNIYFCAMLLPTVVMMIKYSENYKGAWIYRALPVKDTSCIFSGTFKAFIVRLLLPIYIFECIIFICIFGARIIPDLFAVFLNMLLFMVICFKVLGKGLPFSVPYDVSSGSQGIAVFLLMFFIGILALIHFFCTLTFWGIYVYIAVLIVVNALVWRKAFKLISF